MRERTFSCKTISLAVALVLVLVMSAFTLVGCGEVSAETLEETYAAFQAEIEKLQTSDNGDAVLSTDYVMSYGTKVNSYVSNGNDTYADYKELETTYNAMIKVAMEYLDGAMTNVFAIIADGVTSDMQSSVNALNSSISGCNDSFTTFTSARNALISHFENSGSDGTSDGDLAALGQFKKTYGAFAEKIVNAAASAADAIDASGTMTLITTTDPTSADIENLQNFVSIKIAQVFCHVLLTEVGSKITWSTYKDTEWGVVVTEYETLFASYQTTLVTTSTGLTFPDNGDDEQTIKEKNDALRECAKSVLSALDAFLVEIEDFETALSGLDIATLATDYSSDLTKYVASNEFAQIYLDKLEQFVTYSLPYFIDYVATTLALS